MILCAEKLPSLRISSTVIGLAVPIQKENAGTRRCQCRLAALSRMPTLAKESIQSLNRILDSEMVQWQRKSKADLIRNGISGRSRSGANV